MLCSASVQGDSVCQPDLTRPSWNARHSERTTCEGRPPNGYCPSGKCAILCPPAYQHPNGRAWEATATGRLPTTAAKTLGRRLASARTGRLSPQAIERPLLVSPQGLGPTPSWPSPLHGLQDTPEPERQPMPSPSRTARRIRPDGYPDTTVAFPGSASPRVSSKAQLAASDLGWGIRMGRKIRPKDADGNWAASGCSGQESCPQALGAPCLRRVHPGRRKVFAAVGSRRLSSR